MIGITGDALRVEDDGEFINRGEITIQAVPTTVNDNAIEIIQGR